MVFASEWDFLFCGMKRKIWLFGETLKRNSCLASSSFQRAQRRAQNHPPPSLTDLGQDHLDEMLFDIKQTFLTFVPQSISYLSWLNSLTTGKSKVYCCLSVIISNWMFYLLAALCLTAACRTSTYRLNDWLCFELHDIGRTCFTEDPVEDVESLRMSSRNWKGSLSKGCQ